MNFNKNLTENDIDKMDIKSQLEHQIKIQETKERGWIIDRTSSVKLKFYKTVEVNGSIYVKIPFRSNAILNFENIDEYCFSRSILAFLYPRDNTHPTKVNNYLQNLYELNIDGFDFTNEFKCSDMQISEIKQFI